MSRKKKLQKKRARLKIKKLVKRATKDRRITKAEAKKVRKIARRNNITTKIGLNKAKKKTKSRYDPNAKKWLKKANKKWSKPKKDDPKPDKGKDKDKPDIDEGKDEDFKDDQYEDEQDDRDDQIEDDIEDAASGDTKKYKKFDYEKELEDASDRAKDRDKDARKEMSGEKKRIKISDKKLKQAEKETGYARIKDRINDKGRLQDKKGQLKAKPPSLDKYKKKIQSIKSPYHDRIAKISGGYGEEGRANRSRKRLDYLSKKLNPKNTTSPFNSTKKKMDRYKDDGNDILKKFSSARKMKVRKRNQTKERRISRRVNQ